MGEEGQRVEGLLADPAREAPEPVLAAFVDGFEDWAQPELDARLQDRAREALQQRQLASDALGAALALVDWLCREVLPLVSLDLADLPSLPDFAALEPLNSALACHEHEAEEAWLNAERHDDDKHAAWSIYDAIRDTRRAILALRRIPKYRAPDPGWKAKQARPTPMSLCQDAVGIIATAFSSIADELPDAERALDRLGLDGGQDGQARVERARRALDRLDIDGGLKLLDLAERVVVGCDAAAPGRPEEIADRALKGFAHEPVATVAGSAALRERALDSPARTVSEAASSVLRAACVELATLLLADPITRGGARRRASAPTRVEAAAPRPTADDHVRRIVASLERGRRDARGALRTTRQLGAELNDGHRREVAAAVLDRLMSKDAEARRREPLAHGDATLGQLLAAARFRLGALDGPMLVPLAERSFVHLWRSEPAEAIEQAQTLCGARIVAGTAWRRLFDLPSDRDDEYLFGYGSNRRPCVACLKAAREDGAFPPTTDEPEWSADLRARAIDAVLAMDIDGEEWRWTEPLDALLRDEARRLALADAARMGVLCAQRTLGPARFLKEQAACRAQWARCSPPPNGARCRRRATSRSPGR